MRFCRNVPLLILIFSGVTYTGAGAQTRPTSAPTTAAVPAREAILLKTAERVAAELEWLDLKFVYDRPPEWGPNAEKAAALYNLLRSPPEDILPAASWQAPSETGDFARPTTRQAQSSVTPGAFYPGPWSVDDIRPLPHHSNPKLRTLGIVLIYQLNRVDLLPEIADLSYDEAKSFSGPIRSAIIGSPWHMRDQAVSSFAIAAVNAYLGASAELGALSFEFGMTVPRRDRYPAFRERLVKFATARDPTMCTAALSIAMQRATTGTTPLRNIRRDRVQEVLAVLEQIAVPRRFFVAYHLNIEKFYDDRYPRDYLLNLARQVPHDVRMRAILGKHAIDDPDLDDFAYKYFQDHAAELFTAKDADVFLAAPSAADASWLTRASPEAGLILAAARLRPASAEAILLPAIDAFKEDGSVGSDTRHDIAVELCLLGNDQGIARGIDWFFAFTPQRGTYGRGREGFLYSIASRDPIRARSIVERIVRDKRLVALGPASTRVLIQRVSGYLGRPLASEEEIRDSYGIDEAQRDRKLAALESWHAALQKTVDEWSK